VDEGTVPFVASEANSAAFFDLDRTLLRGASGPVISEALRAVGVVSGKSVPGEQLLYRVFDAVGETLPAMVVTRQLARAANGWDRASVQEAGRKAAEHLVDQVPTFAKMAIAQHQAAGRRVVMATTTPYDLVKPLADALGLDDVIATRYTESGGRYTGGIVGNFVWGTGKLASVRDWSADHGVSMADSWAYSDSVFDVPLLSAVGRAVAVNPDPRLTLVALARRWPIQHFDVPEGVVKVGPIETQRVLQLFAQPALFPWVRFDIDGVEHIPREGPAIVVANHRSYFDPLAIGFAMARAKRSVRFLGKKEVFDAPVVGQLAAAIGGIAVDRGSGSDEPLAAAARALEGGEIVVILPQGTIPRGRAFFEPELEGRWGAARLAALSEVPVIPMGLWNTEAVWPRSSRTPNVLALANPPTVRVRVGPSVDVKHRSPDADTKRMMKAISALLPAEARQRHEPTPEELARTFPPGYKGDPDAEVGRRPGTD
jgi:putative phosphoserine phosphatase/1-acylglycerol-3-phosphate O-acyltransferase